MCQLSCVNKHIQNKSNAGDDMGDDVGDKCRNNRYININKVRLVCFLLGSFDININVKII